MESFIRTFIATELDANTQSKLKIIQDSLKDINCDIKWVEQKNIHLTLKFLGSTQEKQVEQIAAILKNLSLDCRSKELIINEIGTFPMNKNPRVIWVGINDNKKYILGFVSKLENKLEEIGFSKEDQEFLPHITLGRIKSQKNMQSLIEKIKTYQKIKDVVIKFNNLTLFKSTLLPKGPIYEKIFSINLR